MAEVDARGIGLGSRRCVEAQLRIWTAGICGPALFKRMAGLPHGRSGRLPVDALLRCRNRPDIFTIGDCSEWIDPASGKT